MVLVVKVCPGCSAACIDSHRHCPTCGADISQVLASDGDPFIGTTFAGKYKIASLIGTGAMGRVYRARHLALDAEVAIKLVNPDVAADALTAKRFQTEARAASRLRHPNTIQILDFGQSESGALFLVMEYLRGRTLAKILEEEFIVGARRISDLLGQALAALDEAHASGVVHRDFKPENVFVEMLRTGREHVKVLDFGIAKLRGEADAGLTSRGAVCGTPEYMSPEQIRGEELDARSDVYAAGVVLYELMTGERPFESRGPVIEILQAHLGKPVVPPRQRRPELNLPRPLDEVCMRALAKEVDRRYRSAAELKTAIEVAVRGHSGEHCPNCGMPLPGKARFCPECGTVLRPAGAAGAAPAGGAVAPPVAQAELPRLSLPLPLVGRESVLDRLDGLENEAILLVGAPGVGKTALVEAWVRREEARFRKVAVAGADPSGATRPWYPIRKIMAQILGLNEPVSRTPLMRTIQDLPAEQLGLAELFGCTEPEGTPLPLDVRRRECEAASLNLMRRAAWTLVFEDVDQWDRPSKRLLARLISDPGASTVLATAANAESVDVEVECLRLGPLDAAAIDQLAQLGLPPGVAELAGGVPLAIVEWLRSRLEGVREASMTTRLGKLTADARALLEALGVAGGDVPGALLSDAAGLGDLAGATAVLASAGWLRPTGLELASPTVRRRIYDTMPAEWRAQLHGRLAAALRERDGDPVVVGYHAYLGNDPKLGELIERAADVARDRFDDDAAVRWYRGALERGRQALTAGYGDEGRQIRIALKLGIVLRYRGDVIQSEHVLKDALELASQRNDRWAQVQARRALARLAMAWQQHENAREHLVAAVQVLLGGSDPTGLAEVYIELSESMRKLGDREGAERELWEGLMLCTSGDGPEGNSGPEPVWRMLILLGNLAIEGQRPEAAIKTGQHAVRHAERVGTPLGRARARTFLATAYDAAKKPREAAEQRRLAADELRRAGDRRATAELLLTLAEANRGDKAAHAWVEEAELLATQLGWQEGVNRSRAVLK
jgi:serine/threonine-protein kinase